MLSMKDVQGESSSSFELDLIPALDAVYDNGLLRSDRKLSKLINDVSIRSVESPHDLMWQCDLIEHLISLEIQREKVVPVAGTRSDINSIVTQWLSVLSEHMLGRDYIPYINNNSEIKIVKESININDELKEKLIDCIEKLSTLGFIKLYSENVVGMIMLITPTDVDSAMKVTASLLAAARLGNFCATVIPLVMPILCELLCTLTNLIDSSNGDDSNNKAAEGVLADVAELIWTLIAQGSTAAVSMNTLLRYLERTELNERSKSQEELKSIMSTLNGVIKSIGAALWGNPPYANGVYSLRIYWLETLSQLKTVLNKLVLLYSKKISPDLNESASNVILEAISAVRRLVDGHLHALTPDEWDALEDIIEFGVSPFIVGFPSPRARSSSISSRSHDTDDDRRPRSKDAHTTEIDLKQKLLLKTESLKLLHQFQFQESSPPIHFNLTLLRLLLVGESVLDLHAARGILDEPVQYISQFMDCIFTGNTDAESRLEALKLITEPQFFPTTNPGSSYASISIGGSLKSVTSQSTYLTQPWQQYYVNLPPPSMWEVCVIHKAPGFINFFLQILTDCVSFKRHRNAIEVELHLHAIRTLGRIYRSIYTVATDREYVLDTLVNIACGSNIGRGINSKDCSSENVARVEAIYQIECALVVSFGTLVHTHSKVPRLVSTLMQIARQCTDDHLLVSKALIPLCRLRSDEYGRASILPRSILVEENSEKISDGTSRGDDSENGDLSECESIENDVVLVHPFLFLKRGDTKLGVFRDDNSSKRSHSAKGTILPLDRIIVCLENILSSYCNVDTQEGSFILSMIYSTFEHWALSGIDIDIDRTSVPLLQDEDVSIERCKFLSCCVHYFDEDDETIKLIPDNIRELISYLKSDNCDILSHACRGLILFLSDKDSFTKYRFDFILKEVIEQLEENTVVVYNGIDRRTLLLFVIMEHFTIHGINHISKDLIIRAYKVLFNITSNPTSRDSQLFALQCTSLLTRGINDDLANEIYDELFQVNGESIWNVGHYQSEESLAVFSDLFGRRNGSPWIKYLDHTDYTGSKTILVHKALSRETDDIKLFMHEKAGAWCYGNSIITCRIGKSMTIYQGWIEFTIRSATRCHRQLVRLPKYPTFDYDIITQTPWTDQRKIPLPLIENSDSFEKDAIDSNAPFEYVSNIMSEARTTLRAFDSIENLFNTSIVNDNLNENSAPILGNPMSSHEKSPIMDIQPSIQDSVKLDTVPKYQQAKCMSENEILLDDMSTYDEVDKRFNTHAIFFSEESPLTIHQWLQIAYGTNQLELQCVDEIESQIQSFMGKKMLGLDSCDSTETVEQSSPRTSYSDNEKTNELMYDKIQRGLAILDRTVPIEPHKVALFFSCSFGEQPVPNDSETYEDRLLSISQASPQFWEFARGLGTPVRTQDLTYFSGGLDTSDRCEDGEFSLIWMIDEKESLTSTSFGSLDKMVLFHTIPLMPLREKETSTRNRKRHVGNDNIHIIYTERNASLMRRATCSMKDGHVYTNSIIGGEFGLVTIFVDNLPATPAFTRITVQTKESFPGDYEEKLSVLRGSQIIPSEHAPSAVRRIAIRANILCRSLMEDKIGLASNWEERLHLIRKMKKYVKL